ncbi:MAG: WD40 repeat domain-containing protein [Treponema sp.]|nr:WD40 repeat domain-containing protein [Treponema sp.]
MTKKRLILAFLIFSQLFAFAQNVTKGESGEICPLDKAPRDKINFYPSPAMDLRTNVNQIGWVMPGKFFTVTDDHAFIMDVDGNTREEIIPSEGYITFIETASKSKSEAKEMFTLTNTNMVSIRKYPLTDKFPSKNLYPESPVTCATFAPDGSFIATGHKNGQILISMPLLMTGNIYNTDYSVDSKAITALKFSPDANLLACISKGGYIDIWNMKNGTLFSSIPTKKNSPYPINFSADSKTIFSAEDSKNIIEQDLEGRLQRRIELTNKLKTFHISDEGKYLFELSLNNNIYIYNLYENRLLGYIPYFSKSEILDFSFTEDYKKILVAHKCGIIFILDVEDVFLDPDCPQPRLASGSYYGGTGAGDSGGGGEITSEIGEHNIDIRLNLSKPDNPYLINVTPQFGYIYCPMGSSIFFGGLIEGAFCVPNPTFPYAYVNLENGKQIHTPYITGPRVSGVIGYYTKPFPIDMGFFAEVRPTFALYTFYFPEYGFMDYYPSFALELQAGINWKQLLVFAGALYDYRLGFSVSGGIGWRIRIGGG